MAETAGRGLQSNRLICKLGGAHVLHHQVDLTRL